MECPDDAEIVAFAEGYLDRTRRDEIRAHADACAECAGLVAEAARLDPDSLAVGNDAPISALDGDAAPGRGDVVGRYWLLDTLGEGGLGRVYAAYDPELDRKVAIKLIRPEVTRHLSEGELSTRLVREAKALAQVRHPNVVAVHDVGTAHGRVFVAMELVAGTTLRQWLGQARRDWSEIRDVFVAAADGLRAAHAAGLVHRDFKPGNVLLDEAGRVQVADFGLARAVGDSPSGRAAPRVRASDVAETKLDATITASGVVLGTPAYMAPEQHRGATVDAKADQFAFCVALFEALYGARPFAGETIDELLEAIAARRFALPARSARVPRWLHRAVAKGLQHDPAARFESMAELRAALEVDRRQRRRWGAALVAGALTVVAGLGWARALQRQEDPAAVQQVQSLVAAAREAASRAHFVYPPREDPTAPTAYLRVRELEAMTGPGEALADARALQLRKEFAATLVRLGDEYWQRPGGDLFAVDYYAAALVFEPDHPRAAERIRLTPGQLLGLADKAARLAFTDAELVAAAPLVALARADEPARLAALRALYAAQPRPGIATTAALETLLGEEAARVLGIDAAPGPPEPPAIVAAAPIVDDEPTVAAVSEARVSPAVPRSPVVAPRPEPGTSAGSEDETPESASSSPSDPAAARALAALGHAALAEGRLDDAAKAFHGALREDRGHAGALSGLGEVYFQRQAHDKAIDFYERATRAAPKNGSYRIGLGDAYFKVLRYDDALAQYERALALGQSRAQRRIDKLHAKLGTQAPR